MIAISDSGFLRAGLRGGQEPHKLFQRGATPRPATNLAPRKAGPALVPTGRISEGPPSSHDRSFSCEIFPPVPARFFLKSRLGFLLILSRSLQRI